MKDSVTIILGLGVDCVRDKAIVRILGDRSVDQVKICLTGMHEGVL